MSEIPDFLLGNEPIFDEKVSPILPESPLGWRLLNRFEKNVAGPDLLTGDNISVAGHDYGNLSAARDIATKIQKSGVYNRPISFGEFENIRKSAFKALCAMWKIDEIGNQKTFDKNELPLYLTQYLLSQINEAIGILSPSETALTRGNPSKEITYWDEDESEKVFNKIKPNSPANPTLLKNQNEAAYVISRWSHNGFKTAIYLGYFDMDNEGQKDTAIRARQLLGAETKLLIGVAEDKESEMVKGRSPQRKISRRLDNMIKVAGVDGVFPIILPDWVQTRESLTKFGFILHKRLKPHFRIAGHPKTHNGNWLNVYTEQCKEADILFLTNDHYTDISTTREIEEIKQS